MSFEVVKKGNETIEIEVRYRHKDKTIADYGTFELYYYKQRRTFTLRNEIMDIVFEEQPKEKAIEIIDALIQGLLRIRDEIEKL